MFLKVKDPALKLQDAKLDLVCKSVFHELIFSFSHFTLTVIESDVMLLCVQYFSLHGYTCDFSSSEHTWNLHLQHKHCMTDWHQTFTRDMKRCSYVLQKRGGWYESELTRFKPNSFTTKDLFVWSSAIYKLIETVIYTNTAVETNTKHIFMHHDWTAVTSMRRLPLIVK